MLNFESWSNSRDIQVNFSSVTPIIIKYQLAGEIEVGTDNTFPDRYCVTIGNDSRSFFNLHEAERYLWIEWVYPEAVTEYNRAVAEEMDRESR